MEGQIGRITSRQMGEKARKSKPSQWGSGDKANMGASSVHLSRPRRSFGDVPIPGKVTRPPGRNPQRKSREEGRQGEPRPIGRQPNKGEREQRKVRRYGKQDSAGSGSGGPADPGGL